MGSTHDKTPGCSDLRMTNGTGNDHISLHLDSQWMVLLTDRVALDDQRTLPSSAR
jgi:hypothetical protein